MSSKSGFSLAEFERIASEVESAQKDVSRLERREETLDRQISEVREELSAARKRLQTQSTSIDMMIRRGVNDLQKGPNAGSNRSALISLFLSGGLSTDSKSGQGSLPGTSDEVIRGQKSDGSESGKDTPPSTPSPTASPETPAPSSPRSDPPADDQVEAA